MSCTAPDIFPKIQKVISQRKHKYNSIWEFTEICLWRIFLSLQFYRVHIPSGSPKRYELILQNSQCNHSFKVNFKIRALQKFDAANKTITITLFHLSTVERWRHFCSIISYVCWHCITVTALRANAALS